MRDESHELPLSHLAHCVSDCLGWYVSHMYRIARAAVLAVGTFTATGLKRMRAFARQYGSHSCYLSRRVPLEVAQAFMSSALPATCPLSRPTMKVCGAVPVMAQCTNKLSRGLAFLISTTTTRKATTTPFQRFASTLRARSRGFTGGARLGNVGRASTSRKMLPSWCCRKRWMRARTKSFQTRRGKPPAITR